MCSGIGTYIRNLLPRLKNGPFKLKVILNSSDLEKWKEASSFELILTETPIYSVQEQLKLPFLIPSCDLFWSPHFNVPLGMIRAKKRLTTIHDVYFLAYSHVLPMLKKIYSKAVINRAAKIADQIVTDSYFSQDEIVKYTSIYKNKIEVIHLGVDRTHFYPHEHPERIRKKYQLPERFFLFVSNLAPHKNIQGLVRALSFLKDEKVVFVGKQTQKGSLEKIVKITPSLMSRLIFLGHVDQEDLPLMYQLASATIHPSLYEGFGFTPLEAMSCGCPVVVSKIASLPEICGESAVYVDPNDPEDIARGMQKIGSDRALCQMLKTQGLERSRLFDWDKTAERYLELLGRLL